MALSAQPALTLRPGGCWSEEPEVDMTPEPEPESLIERRECKLRAACWGCNNVVKGEFKMVEVLKHNYSENMILLRQHGGYTCNLSSVFIVYL